MEPDWAMVLVAKSVRAKSVRAKSVRSVGAFRETGVNRRDAKKRRENAKVKTRSTASLICILHSAFCILHSKGASLPLLASLPVVKIFRISVRLGAVNCG